MEFDFECEGVAYELLASEAFDEFGCDMIEFDDDRRCFTDVAFECVLATDRFADIYSFDWAKVDASGKIVVGLAHLAKLASEHSKRALAKVLACVDAKLAHAAGSIGSYAPELFDVESFDKIEGFVGMDDEESVGFAIV